MRSQHLPQSIMQQMGRRVIIFRGNPFVHIHLGRKHLSQILWQTICYMNGQPVFLVGIQNAYLLRFRNQPAAVTDLSPALAIERGNVKHQLIERLSLRTHPAIAGNLHLCLRVVIPHEFLCIIGNQFHPIIRVHGSSRTGTFFLSFHLRLELPTIYH